MKNPAMKKILLALSLSLAVNGAYAQGAKKPLPANTPVEVLKPGEWVWYADAVPEGPMLMLVSISQQKAFLYRNGIRIGVSTVSTGKKGHETPTGVFTILQKNKDHKSNLYKDAKNNAAAMPFMQRLTWDGIALHSGNLPGYPASHGCVRMPDGFAQRLFAETVLGMTVIVSNDKVASPENLVNPNVFAQSMDATGKTVPVEPLSIYEDYRWQPEKSLFGPVTVLISTRNQTIIALRNGIEIGRSKVGVVGGEPFGSQAYVVLDGFGKEKSRIVPGQMELKWLRVNAPNDAGVESEGLDAKAISRIAVPVDFARLVYSTLRPGSSMLLTDEAINLEATTEGMTVLTDETDAEHEAEDNGN
jgi:L,D-transpeptidase catalytic domain